MPGKPSGQELAVLYSSMTSAEFAALKREELTAEAWVPYDLEATRRSAPGPVAIPTR
jgi:hypothetical protein